MQPTIKQLVILPRIDERTGMVYDNWLLALGTDGMLYTLNLTEDGSEPGWLIWPSLPTNYDEYKVTHLNLFYTELGKRYISPFDYEEISLKEVMEAFDRSAKRMQENKPKTEKEIQN